MKIEISEIEKLTERLREINRLNLQDIQWIDENGKISSISPELIDEFKFTGLNNVDFIMSGFFRWGWDVVKTDRPNDLPSPQFLPGTKLN